MRLQITVLVLRNHRSPVFRDSLIPQGAAEQMVVSLRIWSGLVIGESKITDGQRSHNPCGAGPRGHRLQECLPLDSRGVLHQELYGGKLKQLQRSPISNVEKSHSGSAYKKVVIIEFGFYNNITTVEGKEEKEELLVRRTISRR